MPELPEVEVLRRFLHRSLTGRRVCGVEILRPRRVGEGVAGLRGGVVTRVERRGKYLLLELGENDGAHPDKKPLLIHLGMTGRVYVEESDEGPLPKHAVLVLQLDRGRCVFEDARGFGRVQLGRAGLEELGLEPLEPGLTPAGLHRLFGRSQRALKVLLLDQALVAGIGNIYASEALFLAGLAPTRRGDRLSLDEAGRLVGAIREVLTAAITLGERAELGFGPGGSGDGLFYFGSATPVPAGASENPVERFRVYDRAGEPCVRCGNGILREVLGGRSTYWCGRCQR